MGFLVDFSLAGGGCARAAHVARRGADFGVITGEVSVDFSKVMDRQNKMRHGGSKGMERWLRGMGNVTVYDGYGTFACPHSVQIGDDLIEGETIVISAGGRARIFPIPGIEDVDWLDNVRLLRFARTTTTPRYRRRQLYRA